MVKALDERYLELYAHLPGHKKKGGTPGTPELHGRRGSASPTGSLISEGGEGEGVGGTAVHPLDEVLTGDEIQALRITKEKLRKVLTHVTPE